MEKLKITPDNWEVVEAANQNGGHFKVYAGETCICTITTRNKETAEANANIIADSPTMFAALAEIKRLINMDSLGWEQCQKINQLASSIIDKHIGDKIVKTISSETLVYGSGLSERALNCLQNYYSVYLNSELTPITTLDDLQNVSKKQFIKLRGVGMGTVKQVEDVMKQVGLTLKY